MSNQKLSIHKPVVSISELCQMLQLGRSRYYQLVESGFFPPPIYDVRSKRPFYNAELQQQCLESRFHTSTGVNGSVLLFYSRRNKEIPSKKKKQKIDKHVQEYADTLNSMGLDVSAKQVQDLIVEHYPDGTNGQDQGLVIRQLYRIIKQNS